ncbi:MAG: hypothetical protein R3286_13005 [Gammaproteobacteria bacterium]|nr:hypothetical protein [Gammaproteobacteria bacterium]
MQTSNQTNDSYARRSFTWRRMKRWQVGALAVAAAALIVIGLIFVN